MTIKNIHIISVLDATGRWVVNVPGYINARIAVVRQISFISLNWGVNPQTIWSIHSSLSPDVIGSIHNMENGFLSNPQTKIKLSNPNVSNIQFSLTSEVRPTTDLVGDQISILMDFITDEDLKFA